MGPKLRTISPAVRFEPKVNGSMSRVNRDIRFSKDKRPYKDHLDIWFWHGDRKGWNCPGFWFRLTPKEVHLGVGMHYFEKELKPLGFRTQARILDYPGGMPGTVGLFLRW